jgi:LEA14-like dessication related protein
VSVEVVTHEQTGSMPAAPLAKRQLMQKHVRSFTRVATLGALVLTSACASVFRAPEVRLEGIRVGGIGLRGATVVAQLHVDNPNSFGLETRSFTYDLQLRERDASEEWLQLATGTIDQRIEVGGGSEKLVEIPIEFSYSDLGPALRSLLDRGTFDYRVSGQVQVSEPVSRTVPYRKTGRVTLQGVQ